MRVKVRFTIEFDDAHCDPIRVPKRLARMAEGFLAGRRRNQSHS